MSFHLPDILLSIPRNPVTALGFPLTLGILSGFPTAKVVRGPWYNGLFFPPGRPPRQVFSIVWPLLYLSMGYASHLAVKTLDVSFSSSSSPALTLGLALYYAQLGMNIAWSPLFFGYKQVGVALIDSVLMTGVTFSLLWMALLCDIFECRDLVVEQETSFGKGGLNDHQNQLKL